MTANDSTDDPWPEYPADGYVPPPLGEPIPTEDLEVCEGGLVVFDDGDYPWEENIDGA